MIRTRFTGGPLKASATSTSRPWSTSLGPSPSLRSTPRRCPSRPETYVASATDFRRGPGGPPGQLTDRHAEDRVSGKYSLVQSTSDRRVGELFLVHTGGLRMHESTEGRPCRTSKKCVSSDCYHADVGPSRGQSCRPQVAVHYQTKPAPVIPRWVGLTRSAITRGTPYWAPRLHQRADQRTEIAAACP
jgi:hypothetical protein